MKTLKPYKITKVGALYRVKKYSQVNQKLIDSLNWPQDMVRPGIDFKSVPLKKGARLSFKISSKRVPIIACYSGVKGFKGSVPDAPLAGITSRPAKSFAELKKVSRLGFKLYVKQWKGKFSDEFIRNYSSYEKNYLKNAASLLTFRGKRPCGLFVCIKTKGVSGETYDFLTWHNLFPGLSAAEKRSARAQAAEWLKKTAKRQLAVCLDLFDKESYDFFADLGFHTCRVLLERKRSAK